MQSSLECPNPWAVMQTAVLLVGGFVCKSRDWVDLDVILLRGSTDTSRNGLEPEWPWDNCKLLRLRSLTSVWCKGEPHSEQITELQCFLQTQPLVLCLLCWEFLGNRNDSEALKFRIITALSGQIFTFQLLWTAAEPWLSPDWSCPRPWCLGPGRCHLSVMERSKAHWHVWVVGSGLC